MSDLFKTYSLREIGKVSMCKRVLKEQTSNFNDIPFYKISTFGGKADTFISRDIFEDYKSKYSYPKKGDILISAAGTIGKTVIYDGEDGFFQDSNIVWIDNDESKVLNPFLYYFYQTKPWLTTNGSTITRIYNENLRSIKIIVPKELKDQHKIASVLSALDSKIELNNRINTELEAMAKTLYDYWFVQFDFPFDFAQGKPDKNGRCTEPAEVKPYKTTGGTLVWSEELKREIPEGWKKIKMSELYEFQYGFGNTNPNNGGEYPVYGSNGVIGGYDKFNNEDAPVIGHIGNNCGSLVFADGRHYVTYNGVMCKIRKGYNKYFGFVVLQSKDLKSHTRGSSQPFISYDMLNSLDVVIPEPSLMKTYCDLVDPLFDKVIINNKQNQKLTELRDWLLPMLMNGQVKAA